MRQPDRVAVPGTSSPALIVGSVAYDDIETPFSKGTRILGGSASYASLAASFFADVRIVGVVGHDFAPSDKARLMGRGIDLAGLQEDLSGKTFAWGGRYLANFDRRETTFTDLNVFERFRPVLPPAWKASRFALLGNIQPSLQTLVLEQLDPGAFVLADTMDLWIRLVPDEVRALMPRVDLFLINDDEATQFTGERNVILAGRALRAAGARSVIIKKGSHGAILFHDDGLFALPAYPVTELRDPTGAGDSFAGALLGHLAAAGRSDSREIRRAMVHATVTASLTVESFSCDRLESAGATELAERAATLRAMVALP